MVGFFSAPITPLNPYGIFFSKAMYNSSTLELIELDGMVGVDFLVTKRRLGKIPLLLQFFLALFPCKMRWNSEFPWFF